MHRIESKEPMIIAGPCAAETREMVMQTAEAAKARAIDIVRLNLWKPRTKPGFEGMGEMGIPWLVEVAQMGLTPATEVLLTSHADSVIDAVVKSTQSRVLIWLGARNQNHFIQRELGKVIAGEPKALLMVKNQPWADKAHWEGIIDHVLSGGAKEEQLMVCHRGFAPGSNGLRNNPDFEMAMDIKQCTRLPMLFDPSHAGGSMPNVLRIAQESIRHRRDGMGFDGLIVEVHPNPKEALSDKNQQLTWAEFDWLLEKIRG